MILNGTLALQWANVAPRTWEIPLHVSVFEPGTITLVEEYDVMTETDGTFLVEDTNISGTFDIVINGRTTLRRVAPSVAVDNQPVAVDFGVLLTGDANGDNEIDEDDLAILLSTHGTSVTCAGSTGSLPCADFNGDGQVDWADYDLMIANYGRDGDTTIPRGDSRFGVNSQALFYSPVKPPAGGNRQIGLSWVLDLALLGVRHVRVPLAQPADGNMARAARDQYLPVLQLFRAQNLIPLVVLGPEILGGEPQVWNADLEDRGTEPKSNAFIDQFVVQARTIARELGNVANYQIWNESNAPNTYLRSAHFGSMLHYTSQAIRAAVPDAVVVSGGLNFNDDTGANPNLAYLNEDQPTEEADTGLYPWLQRYGYGNGDYPWDIFAIHEYGTIATAVSSLNHIVAAVDTADDDSTIWLTEFGDWRACMETNACTDPDSDEDHQEMLAAWYQAMLDEEQPGPARLAVMFWFCHHQFHDGDHDSDNNTPLVPEDDVYGTWGLTGYDTDYGQIVPEFHWLAWNELRSIIDAS